MKMSHSIIIEIELETQFLYDKVSQYHNNVV